MGDADFEQLLDLTYEASIATEKWTAVVQGLADLVGGVGGFISRLNVRDGAGAMEMARYDPAAVHEYFAHFAAINPLTIVPNARAYFSEWRPRVVLDDELIDKPALVGSEFYNDFMRPNDTHSCMMIRLAAAGDSVFAVTIGRALRHGPFDEENLAAARRLHPHLLRSFALSQELTASRMAREELESLLDNTRQGIVLADCEGRVLRMNRAAQRLVSRGDAVTVSGGRLSAASYADAARLGKLIRNAATADSENRGGGEISLISPGRMLPVAVTVTPMRAGPAKVFGGDTSVMVTLVDPMADMAVSEQRLASLFGLTTAERRVALALFGGQSPREIAETLGSSFFTVRSHLGRIYEKTGTSRQAELVRLMMSAVETG